MKLRISPMIYPLFLALFLVVFSMVPAAQTAVPYQTGSLAYPGLLQLPERGQEWPGPETFRIGNAIAPVHYWMRAWMLNDVFKAAGFEGEIGSTDQSVMWTPVIEGQWQGERRYEIALDAQGYPTSMELSDGTRVDQFITIIMGDAEQPKAFPDGEYRFLYEGEGEVEISGGEVVRETPGEMILYYDGQQTIFISITDTQNGNHLRNMHLYRPDAVEGERFNQTYLEYLRPFSVIRPLHFLAEEYSYGSYAHWEERKPVENSHWGGAFGAPFEVAVDLANQSVSDLWFNVPIAADDEFVRNLAALLLQELDRERKLYLELGNELWNWSFPYALGREYVLSRAEERWPNVLGKVQPYSNGDPVHENMMIFSWQAVRTVEIREIFHEVWGNEAERITVVLAGQVGSSAPYWHPTRDLLESPVAVGEEGIEACGYNVDAFAIAPYVGEPEGEFGFDRSSEDAFFDDAISYVIGEGKWSEGSEEEGLRYSIRDDKALADEFGLPLITYEGGQHFIGSSYTRDVISNHPRMRELYDTLFSVWQEEGGGLFVHYAGIIPRGQNEPGTEPGYFESENFGIKEFQTQTREEAPKWDQVLRTMEEIGQLQSAEQVEEFQLH